MSKPFSGAPIALFCYRRPNHVRKTLMSLMNCEGFEQSPIIVFADGPKTLGELNDIEDTRAVVKELLGDRAEYHFNDANHGLANSIISGVSKVLDRFDRVIVIEDDLDFAPTFLVYMNLSLEAYVNNFSVYQISGYMFDVPELRQDTNALFLPIINSWGWATWKRAWLQFDSSASGWEDVKGDRTLRLRFNIGGAYDFSTMLQKQIKGRIDSWAIRWYWSVFKASGLTLFPPRTLVNNLGFDGSGSHGRGRFRNFRVSHSNQESFVPNIPEEVRLDPKIVNWVFAAIYRSNGGWCGKLIDTCRFVFHSFFSR
jgi:hypothetical protein